MKTKGLKSLMMVPLVFFWGCKSQAQKGTIQHSNDTTVYVMPRAGKDSVTPQVNIRVNKQYDDKGNVKQYDSSYSYSYTGTAGKGMVLPDDSVFSRFRSYFYKNSTGFMSPWYNSVFFNDSLLKYDFFNDDFFRRRFEMNNMQFDKMFRQMDSLKKRFMESNYPNGRQQKNNKSL